MLRMFMFVAIATALVSAFALYAVTYNTRLLAEDNRRAEREIKELTRDISILRAERSYLMRPERIEPLARQMGMAPVRADQFMSRHDLRQQSQRR